VEIRIVRTRRGGIYAKLRLLRWCVQLNGYTRHRA
jgi:hypothetical protein